MYGCDYGYGSGDFPFALSISPSPSFAFRRFLSNTWKRMHFWCGSHCQNENSNMLYVVKVVQKYHNNEFVPIFISLTDRVRGREWEKENERKRYTQRIWSGKTIIGEIHVIECFRIRRSFSEVGQMALWLDDLTCSFTTIRPLLSTCLRNDTKRNQFLFNNSALLLDLFKMFNRRLSIFMRQLQKRQSQKRRMKTAKM